MNILVTGSNGQLGSEFKELAPLYKDYQFHFTDQQELDITLVERFSKFLKDYKINAIINCAAYTAVDQAESNKPDAMLLNATAVKNMAEASAKAGALFVHFSTDYVFDGKSYKPYTENDTAIPKTIYGKTKLDGEIEVIFNAKQALIFRTSWLYSSFGNNFVKTILRKATTEKSLGVVFDQIGTPTYAHDLAKAVLEIIPRVNPKIRTEIYNYSNEGAASWYDFAKAILEFKNLECEIRPLTTKEYPTEAARPQYSILSKAKIKKDYGIEIPYWRDSLKVCLNKL